jgi:hypothetical protein
MFCMQHSPIHGRIVSAEEKDLSNLGNVSDRISAMAAKQVVRDVNNCRKCDGRNGLMGLSLIGVSCLEGGALG